ncbi:peptide MFS transporter [Xylanibacter brevis]|uniref:peptide MFS transporter n=1 Tax=Xylanibacter brevis TaxID=83231 RepID=UPI000480CCE3|nr:peptide MFS transporter [Xylanibacter brevis]
MFENQPKGLYALALANTGERFGYYTMLAVFALFLRANYGLTPGTAGVIYSSFLMFVYFFPLIGGFMADKFGFGKMVTTGIIIMFLGYLLLSVPLGGNTVALVVMLVALLSIGLGTGLFKGNLQVMVGDLYNDPQYVDKRDAGFSIFYMAINIGALFAPTAAIRIMEWAQQNLGVSENDSYHFAFAVACASLILSIAIYYAFRSTFRHVEGGVKKNGNQVEEDTLSPSETKERLIALLLVFGVVAFFWMSFHQNGLSLTYFANEYNETSADGLKSMAFNVWNLVAIIIMVYSAFSLFQGKTSKSKVIAVVAVVAALAFLYYNYSHIDGAVEVKAPIFQQFNPFYVVALTPVSLSIFGWLASRNKEPKAPRKIAYGMIVAAVAFCLMLYASLTLPSPVEQANLGDAAPCASSYWLISTYLILTFGELLLSPMGISFVSKVAPPKYKGACMGGWFVSTALGNQLVMVGGLLWGELPLWTVWAVFAGLCLLASTFMFLIMKRLEKVC